MVDTFGKQINPDKEWFTIRSSHGDRLRPVCTRCKRSKSRANCTYSELRFKLCRTSLIQEPIRVFEDNNNASRSIRPLRNAQRSCDAVTNFPENIRVRQPEQSTNEREKSTPSATTPTLIEGGNVFQTSFGELSGCSSPSNHVVRRRKVPPEEVRLFAFYLDHASYWLDSVSPEKRFSTEIPDLALCSPLLYYSCLAYAATGLHLRGLCDKEEAEQYQTRAISLFIPYLNPSTDSVPAEILLTTTVVLRMSEQLSEPGDDAQCHLSGASLFAKYSSKWSPERLDMPGVAFWTFIRQTLRIAFLFEEECRFDLRIINDSAVISSPSDAAWTNQMTFLLAKLCNLCWSPLRETEPFNTSLKYLESVIDNWRNNLPETFKPWYYHHPHSSVFPTIRYLNRFQALAWQQYYTAKTLLAVYGKQFVETGDYYGLRDYVNSKILVPARLVCGVVISERDVSASINGAHLAAWCGQFFTGYEEQKQLVQWLTDFMDETKWPNRTSIARLQKIWKQNCEDTTIDTNSPPSI